MKTIIAVLSFTVVAACGQLDTIKTTPHGGDPNTTPPPVTLQTAPRAPGFPQANDPNLTWRGVIDKEPLWPAQGTIDCLFSTPYGAQHYYAAGDANAQTRDVSAILDDNAGGPAAHYEATEIYDLAALATSPDIVHINNAVWATITVTEEDTRDSNHAVRRWTYTFDIETLTLVASLADTRSGQTYSTSVDACTYVP